MDERKKQQIIDILLTPIKCTEKSHGTPKICLRNSVIESTQTYYSTLDEDMSDFAIGFYKIIYGIDGILNDDGQLLHSKQLAGDTMCSFNTIANKVPGAGVSKKQRTPYKMWPQYLKDYYNLYHCLANLWLLPIWIGRSTPKMPSEHKWASKSKHGIDDYMDSYLLFLSKEHVYDIFIEQYPEYGKYFGTFKQFCAKHFLEGSACYIRGEQIYRYSHNNNPEDIIQSMAKVIHARAENIVKSKYSDALWDYFNELGLIVN